jgi:hypothetical protein
MGRKFAGLLAVALLAAVSAAGVRLTNVHATFSPGVITTQTGAPGSGAALNLGQGPFSLAWSFTTQHLLVGDEFNPVLRDIDTTVGSFPETVAAGNNAYGYRGDSGQATSAMISGAGATAFCGPGLTYFADTSNNVIRQIDAGGVITTVAGNGSRGYSGDGGPATSAQLNTPLGVACRTGGGFYISDTNNNAVRYVDAGGTITSWWINAPAPTGIVELGSQNVVAASITGAAGVWELTDTNAILIAGSPQWIAGYGGDGGGATFALLNTPTGLAYDFAYSELYIADTGNNLVRKVAGGVITKVAGLAPPAAAGYGGDNGPPVLATLNQPVGLALTGTRSGNTDIMFIADTLNNRVREINVSAGQPNIVTVAGNGSPSWSGDGAAASLAQLGNPHGVAFDGAGNEYFSDNQDNVIREIAASNGFISTVAGVATVAPGFFGDGGSATSALLNNPTGIAVDAAGDIAIADTSNNVVRWVDHASHNITTIAGNGIQGYTTATGSATTVELNLPRAVAIDSSGAVFIADTNNHRVVKVMSGNMSLIGGNGTPGYSGDTGAALNATFNGPRGLAFDGSGNLYISDAFNNRVRRVLAGGGVVTSAGTITTFAGNGTAGLAGDLNLATGANLNHPYGIAFDTGGRLYIADTNNQRIRMVGTDGTISSVVATCGITAGFAGDGFQASIAQLNNPFGVAVNASGNVFVADVNNNRVRMAVAIAGVRPSNCPSATAPAVSTRGSADPGPGGTSGIRIPWLGGTSAGSAAAPKMPSVPFSRVAPPVATAPKAAPAAAAQPAPAAPVAAAPAPAETAVRPPSESAAPPARKDDVMLAPPRTAAAKIESPTYLPVAAGTLAVVALVLLAVRRRRNRRLIGHTRP